MLPGDTAGVDLELALGGAPCLVSVGDHTEILLGYTAAELLSSSDLFRSRIHPDDSALAASLFDAAGGPASGSICFRVRHADGHIRCVQADYRRTGGGGGARLHLHLQDARSVRQQADPEAASHCFRAVLANTSTIMVFKDRNHVYTATSAAFRALLSGQAADRDPIGLTDYDLLPEAEADAFYSAEAQALSGHVPEVREIVRMAGGTWLEVRAYPIKSDAHEVLGLCTVSTNLTERLVAEEQVYEANEALPDSQKLSPIGSYILDVRRGLFATSASIDTMLGISQAYPHDVGGWEALIHPFDRQKVMEYFQSVIATPGRIFNQEYRVVRPLDGEIRWIQGVGRVDRDAQGNAILLRGSLEDITERKETKAALAETKKRLELFIEHAPAGLAMYDREVRYLAVSQRWRQFYGVEGDIRGKCHYDVVKDIPERWKEAHRRVVAGESLACAEDRFDRADGSTLWLRWEMMPWRYDDDSIGGILLFLEDITERKRSQQRLELASRVFADASEGIFVTDLNGTIIEVNDSFTRLTGYTRDEALGKHSTILKSDRHGEHQYSELEQSVVTTGRWRGEQWFRRKDGNVFEVSATITTVYDGAGIPSHYVGFFFDITSVREQERRLEKVTLYDELTGLANRALGLEKLRNAIVAVPHSSQVVGLILFDLDDFKRVNEVHGRDFADRLLVGIASRMKHLLRDGDVLARTGGDEFLVVLSRVHSPKTAEQVAERLLDSIAEPFQAGDIEVRLSATAGATFYPQAEEVDADQMVRQAVQAMYEAKLAGKNRYQVFDAARDSDLRGRYEEIGRIRQALKAGEFVLHYQPKVDMSSGGLIGAEALIRWQHPERGLMLPDRFLPVTENNDLAIEIGEWVIATALKQIESWAAEGHRIPISVNVSPRHLQQDDFVPRLRALMEACPAVEPACLELEILETSTVQDFAHVSGIIQACLAMGIQVAIDDFGTGYSSLSYLKRLPAPVLKIDQAFVRNMQEDPDDLAILQGIMGLANAFRRTVIAEGVETIEQGILLLKLGCSFAQGYGIARPMPAGEILSWYGNWWPDVRWRRTSTLSAQEWPGLVAQAELRSWMLELERYINGQQAAPPEIDEHRCRFGTWLEAEKAGPRSTSPSLQTMAGLHHRAHQAAGKAVEMNKRGNVEEAFSLMHTAGSLISEIESRLSAFISVSESHVNGIDWTAPAVRAAASSSAGL